MPKVQDGVRPCLCGTYNAFSFPCVVRKMFSKPLIILGYGIVFVWSCLQSLVWFLWHKTEMKMIYPDLQAFPCFYFCHTSLCKKKLFMKRNKSDTMIAPFVSHILTAEISKSSGSIHQVCIVLFLRPKKSQEDNFTELKVHLNIE